MKKIIITIAILITGVGGYAQMGKGSLLGEINSPVFSLSKNGRIGFGLNIEGEYLISNKIGLGMELGGEIFNGHNSFVVGGFANYYFGSTSNTIRPYVGFGANYIQVNFDKMPNQSNVSIFGQAGVKWFVKENLYLDFGYRHDNYISTPYSDHGNLRIGVGIKFGNKGK